MGEIARFAFYSQVWIMKVIVGIFVFSFLIRASQNRIQTSVLHKMRSNDTFIGKRILKIEIPHIGRLLLMIAMIIIAWNIPLIKSK